MFYDDVTVGQFCNLSIEETDKVRIWDCGKQIMLFEGTYKEAMHSRYEGRVVYSFNVEDGILCLNV